MPVYPNQMLDPQFLLGAIQERPDTAAIRQGYIWRTLLPPREVPERRLLWDTMVSENNLAGFYSSKGHAIPGDSPLFNSHFADLVDIKAARYLDPDIVGKVRDPGMPAIIKAAGESFTIRGMTQRIQSHVRDSLAWCDDAVEAQIEYMALQALQGSLVWPPVDSTGSAFTDPMPHWNAEETLSVTFPLNSSFVQDASTLAGYNDGSGARSGGGYNWKNSSADPILDLEVIAELMTEEKGISLDGAKIIMSRSTLSHLAFQPNVLRYISNNLSGATFATGDNVSAWSTVNNVKDFIQTKLGFEIVTYDAQWTHRSTNEGTAPTITRIKFLNEGKVIILPRVSEPGFMAMAPHETQDGSYRSGKIPWVYREPIPPYERQMGVNLVSFPILTRPEEHFVLDAYQ